MAKELRAVTVTNKTLSLSAFNKLCDKLSKLRRYSHDYRMIKDFDVKTSNPYWMSGTYTGFDAMLIDIVLDTVTKDTKKFLSEKGYEPDSVRIEIKIITED